MKKTALQEFLHSIKLKQVEGSVYLVPAITIDQIEDALENEKQQMCEFWIDGNKRGWDMSTDWPSDAEVLYNQKFKN